MRLAVIFLALFVAVAFVGSAFAIGSGKKVEFAGGPNGKVIFDGKIHADAGQKCAECHTKIWPMKKGEGMKHADMNAGKGCGVCHTGQKAFKIDDQANCGKCHKK
ncbi:MAG: cytochrome C [Deltaproteobacteria bacterium]|nr:MAG: cytochrome C [Deltaproteobacteria bacterium]